MIQAMFGGTCNEVSNKLNLNKIAKSLINGLLQRYIDVVFRTTLLRTCSYKLVKPCDMSTNAFRQNTHTHTHTHTRTHAHTHTHTHTHTNTHTHTHTHTLISLSKPTLESSAISTLCNRRKKPLTRILSQNELVVCRNS